MVGKHLQWPLTTKGIGRRNGCGVMENGALPVSHSLRSHDDDGTNQLD
jgi:hypothetical protein